MHLVGDGGRRDETLDKAQAEDLLIATLTRIENELAENDGLWTDVVQWRAELRARRAKRPSR